MRITHPHRARACAASSCSIKKRLVSSLIPIAQSQTHRSAHKRSLLSRRRAIDSIAPRIAYSFFILALLRRASTCVITSFIASTCACACAINQHARRAAFIARRSRADSLSSSSSPTLRCAPFAAPPLPRAAFPHVQRGRLHRSASAPIASRLALFRRSQSICAASTCAHRSAAPFSL